jgi:hypothetical protein
MAPTPACGLASTGSGLTQHDRASVDIEWLAQVPLFAGLRSALLISLAGRFATERVDEGQVVVRQGATRGALLRRCTRQA